MSDRKKPSIPKFGSFRPKGERAKDEASPGRSHGQESLEPSTGWRMNLNTRFAHDKDPNFKYIPDDHQDFDQLQQRNDTGIHPSRSHEWSRSIHQEARAGEHRPSSESFFVDLRGDAKNVEFGSLHSYSVPRYNLGRASRIIGLQNKTTIDIDESTEKRVILKADANIKHSARRPLVIVNPPESEQDLQLLVPESSRDALQEQVEYVELSENESPTRDPAPATHSFRSGILGLQGNDSAGRNSTKSKGGESSLLHDPGYKLQRDNAILLDKIQSDPKNVDLWLDLVDFQAKSVDRSDHAPSDQSHRQSLSKLRRTIYERALTHIGKDCHGHDTLLVGLQKELLSSNDHVGAERRWDEIIRDHKDSCVLWIEYLNFKQSYARSFVYEECKASYIQYLRILYGQRLKNDRETRLSSVWISQLHAITRLTCLIQDCGYKELAVSIWQMLLEQQLARLAGLKNTDEHQLMNDFWESGAPRIGGVAAKGLAHFAANGAVGNRAAEAPSGQPEEPHVRKTLDATDDIAEEKKSLDGLIFPLASDSEQSSSDPFRYVMFSDMSEIIANLTTELPEMFLLDTFLCFMQFPPLIDDVLAKVWQVDPFILAAHDGRTNAEDAGRRSLSRYCKQTPFKFFTQTFHTYHSQHGSIGKDVGDVVGFIDRVLETYVFSGNNNDTLVEYWLAFKLHFAPAEAQKAARKSLKQHSTKLRVYNAAALIHAQVSSLQKARQIWAAALNLSPSLSKEEQENAVDLWHSLTMTHLKVHDSDIAFRCLLSIVEGCIDHLDTASASASRRLKSTQYLQTQAERMLFDSKHEKAATYFELLAWLAYLAEDFSIDAAMIVFSDSSPKMAKPEQEIALEKLHQAKCALIAFHMLNKKSYRPAQLRDNVAQSAQLFPENSEILDLYGKLLTQTRVDDRIRMAIHGYPVSRNRSAGLISAVNRLEQELRRFQNASLDSTASSVRNTFRRTLLAPESNVAHSPLLWQMWLYFEAGRLEHAKSIEDKRVQAEQASHLKNVFVDGLRALPWYKPWVVLGLSILVQHKVLGPEEVQGYWDLMAEREMRLLTSV